MFVESDISKRKFKCYVHEYYTDDIVDYERHLCDPKLSHVEIISNGKCFHCGDVLNADEKEGVEHRHFVAGQATHKECRKKLAEELNAGKT